MQATFNGKIAVSKLPCVVGNMTALCDIIMAIGNMNFDDDDFKVVGKLLTSYHREGIKLLINENSVTAILVATHT